MYGQNNFTTIRRYSERFRSRAFWGQNKKTVRFSDASVSNTLLQCLRRRFSARYYFIFLRPSYTAGVLIRHAVTIYRLPERDYKSGLNVRANRFSVELKLYCSSGALCKQNAYDVTANYFN